MTAHQKVVADGTDRNTLVLASGATFTNATGLGQGALSAPNGRWLVYDINPLNDLTRMAGLVSDFRLYDRVYDLNQPINIAENGHGYLSKTDMVAPENYVRSVTVAQPSSTTSVANVGSTVAMPTGSTVTQVAPQLQPLQVPTTGTAVPMLASNIEANATLTAPLTVSVFPGKGFSANLSSVIGSGASVASVGLADGSPLPSWMSWDAELATIRSAQVPVNAASSYLVRALVKDASGALRNIDVMVNPVQTVAQKDRE
jgi:hypothetical protein